MSKIDSYFQLLEKQLRDEFHGRRSLVRDSDVKGIANEKAVGEFLNKFVQPTRIVYNKQIIDHHGYDSDEIDVCACNEYQPAPDTEIMIAEGIDFAVQVKAILTDQELDRIGQNARRLKALTREKNLGDVVYMRAEDAPFYVDRIPYFVLAFESKLSLKTVTERVAAKFGNDVHSRPDGIFILERGAILNVRNAFAGSVTSEINALEFGGRTLMYFLQHIHTVRGGIRRLRSPLANYFPCGIPHHGHTPKKNIDSEPAAQFTGDWSWNSMTGMMELLKDGSPELEHLGPDGFAKWTMIGQMQSREFPTNAFKIEQEEDDPAVEVTAELAAEFSKYLRDKTGLAPDITPFPRSGVPFNVPSKILKRSVKVSFKTEFVSELQKWIISVANDLQIKLRRPHIASDLSWPPNLGPRTSGEKRK